LQNKLAKAHSGTIPPYPPVSGTLHVDAMGRRQSERASFVDEKYQRLNRTGEDGSPGAQGLHII